jgi:hypothetical protein
MLVGPNKPAAMWKIINATLRASTLSTWTCCQPTCCDLEVDRYQSSNVQVAGVPRSSDRSTRVSLVQIGRELLLLRVLEWLQWVPSRCGGRQGGSAGVTSSASYPLGHISIQVYRADKLGGREPSQQPFIVVGLWTVNYYANFHTGLRLRPTILRIQPLYIINS